MVCCFIKHTILTLFEFADGSILWRITYRVVIVLMYNSNQIIQAQLNVSIALEQRNIEKIDWVTFEEEVIN